ncbi:ATP-binding cassette domain-containing protein [Corynebacterium kalidii]|uniref:UvrABC system protein A n=1 Tax=Corynebacterium kalidii TaxID=2931982 RepID=A0A9X1WJU0_9CORY|nr:ATP-binding cassette domain-containing protein [Corynebacterium kalidii]MCJ7857657.1 ATP-binding cassette domain-containing protein [Corynebacterium kalidii]
MHTHEITVTGARTHNLTGIDVSLPKHAFTVVTGVSGSGKTSLVFATIAAEAQSATAASYPSFVRARLAKHPRADCDKITGLTFTVVVDQRRFTGNARSTVATATDVAGTLRMLFSRFGTPSAGFSPAYSPNDPAGMCRSCQGLGTRRVIDDVALVDTERTLREGPILFPSFQPGGYRSRQLIDSGLADPDIPWGQLPESTRHTLLHADKLQLPNPGEEYAKHGLFTGAVTQIRKRYLAQTPPHITTKEARALDQLVRTTTCPACDGSRVNAEARASMIDGRSIADWMDTPVTRLRDIVAEVGDLLGERAAPLVDDISATLDGLADVGLGYLTLGRPSPGLSGGEAQRVKIVRQLASSLTDVTYILDEPSIGLHAHDVHRLAGLLCRLRDRGNTVLVVEHNRRMIQAADRVLHLGPGAGNDGGRLVYAGPPSPAPAQQRFTPRRDCRTPRGQFLVTDACSNNLDHVTARVPEGVLTVVTGVAGSGKSSLVMDFVTQHPEFVVISQQPLHGGRRSTPLTVMSIADEVRSVFARAGKAEGLDRSWFSRNSKGACPECGGRGEIVIDLAFLDDTVVPCDACSGTGFNEDARSVTVNGTTIADVADLPPTRLASLLSRSGRRRLAWMDKVGLGHIAMGRGIDTLSGGERQRLLLAKHLATATASPGTRNASDDCSALRMVLDEPTAGLHSTDVAGLLHLFDDLVDHGATLIVIEHNLQVAAHADHIIDVGPGAGHDGGRVVFSGTPSGLATSGTTTGDYLRQAADF